MRHRHGKRSAASAMCALILVATPITVQAHHPALVTLLATVPVGQGPSAITVLENPPRVLVANTDGNSMSILDPMARKLMHTIPTGIYPQGFAVNPLAHRVFLLHGGGTGSLAVLDARTGTILRYVALGDDPTDIAISVKTNRLFVANEGPDGSDGFPHQPGRIDVIDATTGDVLRTTTVDSGPIALAVDARTGHVFVLCIGYPNGNPGLGSVTTLDAHNGRVLNVASVGSFPFDMGIDSTTGRIFVSNDYSVANDSNTISVLRTEDGAALQAVDVANQDGGSVTVDSVTKRVFIANVNLNTVTMLDSRIGIVLRTITVGHSPGPIAVNPRTGHVFVVNTDSHTLSVLDATTGMLLTTLPVGKGWGDIAVDDEAGRVFVSNPESNTVSIFRDI